MTGLTAADAEVLEFARETWKWLGNRDEAIRVRFGLTAPAYYLRLNTILDTPEAESYDPELVRRLREQRDTRATARFARAGWTA